MGGGASLRLTARVPRVDLERELVDHQVGPAGLGVGARVRPAVLGYMVLVPFGQASGNGSTSSMSKNMSRILSALQWGGDSTASDCRGGVSGGLIMLHLRRQSASTT